MIPPLGAIDPLATPTLDADRPQTGGTAAASGPAEGFGTLLSETLGRTVGRLEQAERLSIQALQGDADVRQVVDAVMDAEQTLQAAIAIRDKIVTAYLEISRMTI